MYLFAVLASTAETAAAESSGSSLIMPDWRTLLFTILNLILLFVIMRNFLAKPVQKMLEDRKKASSAVLDEAKKLQTDAQDLLEQADKKKEEAGEEARKISSESVANAQAMREEILKKARDDAKSIIKTAEEEAKGEREITEQELKSRSKKIIESASKGIFAQIFDAEMASAHTKKIIGSLRELTACDIRGDKANLCDIFKANSSVKHIIVETAIELTTDQKNIVTEVVHDYNSTKPMIEFVTNPSLISGLRIALDDSIFEVSTARMIETSVSNLR